MPDFPIIDSHIHVIDHGALPYTWVGQLPPVLRADYGVDDFRDSLAGVAVERAVMVEFLVDEGHHLTEAKFAQHLVDTGGIVAAFVANVPVERGAAVVTDLEALVHLPAVRAIRRILPEGSFDIALEADFIAGVRAVGTFGLPFEIGVAHTGLGHALELVRRCPEVTFVLDHLGTPPIRPEMPGHWTSHIGEFARLPNVIAKLSGLAAGAGPGGVVGGQITTYLRYALDCFGPERAMYGSDWPMLTPVLSYAGWVEIVDAATAELAPAEKRMVYRENAVRTYRLNRGRT